MKKIFSLFIVACLLIGILAALPFSVGATEAEVEISSVDEWMLYVDGANNIGGEYKYPNNKFIITADVLDFEGRVLTPILGFNGELDGQGAILKNITMTSGGGDVALFCELGAATVKNLAIESSSFTGEQWVGTIACCVSGPAVIENVYVASDVSVVATRVYEQSSDCASAGGLVGGCFATNEGSVPAVTIKNSVFAGTVSASCKAVGGFVGNGNSTADKTHNIVIENCLVLGSVSSEGKADTSGFVGSNGESVTVTNSIYAGEGFESYPFGKANPFTATGCYTGNYTGDGVAYKSDNLGSIEGVTLVDSLRESFLGTDAIVTLEGWTKRADDIMVPTGVADFAPSTASKFAKTYTITWQNYDGTVLLTEEYLAYDTPGYNGEAPTQESDDTYNYIFVSWSPYISPVSCDQTYTAEFIMQRKNAIVDDVEEEEDGGADTQAPSGSTQTEPAPDPAPDPAPETEAASGGCGGTIGIVGVAMITLVSGAALVIKKKD